MDDSLLERTGCPFDRVHRRMEDTHTLWHQAQESYFNPHKFRPVLQSCIIQMRTVTWVLQKQCGKIVPDFKSWYGSWQEKMKSDPLMLWAVNSRNFIEKQGDLEMYSKLTAKIIASYSDCIPETEVTGELFESVEAMLERVDKRALAEQVLDHGFLEIDRRWVANSLPDYEILDGLAEIYGTLSLLVDDMHRQTNLPIPFAIDPSSTKDDIKPASCAHPSRGRERCMVGHNERKAKRFVLKTGEEITEVSSEEIDQEDAVKAAQEKYGPNLKIEKFGDDSFLSVAKGIFAMSKSMFLIDGGLQSVAFIFHQETMSMHGLNPADRTDKYLFARYLATEVDRCSGDRIIMVGECWNGKHDPENPFAYPSQSANDGESLFLWASSREGENFALNARVFRDPNGIRLDETVVDNDAYPMVFEPIRKIWLDSKRSI